MSESAGKRINASVYIICRDEAQAIGDCLASVARFADIVVVDSGSTDGTLEIVHALIGKGLPVRLFERPWPGYAKQKQFALETCARRWCLNLDADERIDGELAEAIADVVTSNDEPVAYQLTRREWLPGYGFVHPWAAQTRIVRLIDRDHASYDSAQHVHESPTYNGRCGRIVRGSIWHKPRLTIEQIVDKQNVYSTLKARMSLEKGKSGRPWRMLTSPIGYFLKYFVLKRYFLCGWAGYAISALHAQYAFQSAWKTWCSHPGEDPASRG